MVLAYFPMAQATPGPLTHLVPIFLMFAIFYFLLIRPQQQKQKEHEQRVKTLAKNDEVITSGGLHGTIVGLKEKSVLLRIAENVKVEVERSAISEVVKSRGEVEDVNNELLLDSQKVKTQK